MDLWRTKMRKYVFHWENNYYWIQLTERGLCAHWLCLLWVDNSKLHYQLGHFHDIILYIYIDGLSYLPSIENSNITNRSRNRNSHIGGSDWSSCLQNLQLKHEFELKAVLQTSWKLQFYRLNVSLVPMMFGLCVEVTDGHIIKQKSLVTSQFL